MATVGRLTAHCVAEMQVKPRTKDTAPCTANAKSAVVASSAVTPEMDCVTATTRLAKAVGAADGVVAPAVGPRVGAAVGNRVVVGRPVGAAVGTEAVGRVGLRDGATDGVKETLGANDTLGAKEMLGAAVGLREGGTVGVKDTLGADVVGGTVGVKDTLGADVGLKVGSCVGG